MNIIKFILCLAVIFISGCSIVGYQFDLGSFNLGGSNVATGDDRSGLIMSFDYRKPPVELSEGDPFQVAVNLKNTGEEKVNGQLCIGSLYKRYLGISDLECDLVVLGSVKDDSAPSEKKIYFPSPEAEYSYSNLDSSFSQTDSVSATFNYEIESVSSSRFCIRGDVESSLPAKISCPDIETLSGKGINNMKAPIVVSSIDKNVGNSRVSVDIKLSKITPGEVLDNLNYEVSFEDGTIFNCGSSSGQLPFDKNEKVIKCNANLNIGQDYVDQVLQIGLKYRFKRLISTQITINKEEM